MEIRPSFFNLTRLPIVSLALSEMPDIASMNRTKGNDQSVTREKLLGSYLRTVGQRRVLQQFDQKIQILIFSGSKNDYSPSVP